MLKAFSHVMLFSANVPAAVTWYRDVLGFQDAFSSEHYASLFHSGIGARLDVHGTSAGSPNIGHGPEPYFSVVDIDQAVTVLRERGVKVDEPRSEGGSPRFTTFFDADGNALGLTETR